MVSTLPQSGHLLKGLIEIARSLLGRPRGGMSTSVNRGKRR
jgi:hypothetical protein